MTAPPLLLSIDPGIDRCGVALFEDGVLARADHVGDPLPASTDVLERAVRTAAAVGLWIGDVVEDRGPLDLLVVEWPQVYMPGKSKGGGRDVVLVAAVAAAVATRVFAKERRSVRPDQWKGQSPKSVVQGRVAARLTDDEKKAIGDLSPSRMHNLIDAVALGLYALRRMG